MTGEPLKTSLDAYQADVRARNTRKYKCLLIFPHAHRFEYVPPSKVIRYGRHHSDGRQRADECTAALIRPCRIGRRGMPSCGSQAKILLHCVIGHAGGTWHICQRLDRIAGRPVRKLHRTRFCRRSQVHQQCPDRQRAFSFSNDELVPGPYIVEEKYIRCGVCVDMCPIVPEVVDWHDNDKS